MGPLPQLGAYVLNEALDLQFDPGYLLRRRLLCIQHMAVQMVRVGVVLIAVVVAVHDAVGYAVHICYCDVVVGICEAIPVEHGLLRGQIRHAARVLKIAMMLEFTFVQTHFLTDHSV